MIVLPRTRRIPRMNKGFLKATALYILCISAVFYLIWIMLDIAVPDARLNLVRALATAFGVSLPDTLFSQSVDIKVALALVAISCLSIGLIVLNVYFGAVVTSYFIRPRVSLVTSKRGVLSSKWNASMPYVLVRMSNFHKTDLVDIKLSVVLTVEEIRSNGVKNEPFMCYLPIKDFTPTRILVMAQRMPWTIAVPADALFSNSLALDYHFKPGQPITKSFSSGKKLSSAKRTLEILIQGVDERSYASFVIHHKVLIDEQQGDQYILHLHQGSFKSLPLHITSEKELEQYAA